MCPLKINVIGKSRAQDFFRTSDSVKKEKRETKEKEKEFQSRNSFNFRNRLFQNSEKFDYSFIEIVLLRAFTFYS